MTIIHDQKTSAPLPGELCGADIQWHIREAHRLRAETMAATLRSLGRKAAQLAGSLRLALQRQRERRAVITELQGYTDQELQHDLLIPRSDIGWIASDEADRRLAARAAQTA